MEQRSWSVFQRLVIVHVSSGERDVASLERELVWLVVEGSHGPVRRTLVDPRTGEVLDDVWLDEEGLVRAYSAGRDVLRAPVRRQPGLVEAVVAAPGGADDDVIEDGGNDRVLPAEREFGPRVAEGGGVADVAVEGRDAA
jgi:hypothetical protein